MPPCLILIVGCYNSGTTLLNNILSQHPEISGLSTEGVSLTKEFRTPEEFGWNRLWYKCRDQVEINKLKTKPDIDRVKRDWAQHFDCHKPFALEKSIIHSLNIDWFEENFAQPYFIWIIRNGYAVVEGIRRRTLQKQRKGFAPGTPYPIEWCVQQWLQSNKVIEEKLLDVKHRCFLRYEDLVDNYKSTCNHLLDQLPVTPKVFKKPESFTFHNKSLPITNMNDSSIQNLKKADICKINEIAKEMLKKFNYEIL